MLAEMDRLLRKAAVAADGVLVALSFVLAYALARQMPRLIAQGGLRLPAGGPGGALPPFGGCAWMLLIAEPVWIASFFRFGVYRSLRERRPVEIFWNVFDSALASVLVFSAIVYFLGAGTLTKAFAISLFVFSTGLIFLEKWSVTALLRRLRRKGYNSRTVLIAGSGRRAADFARVIEAHPHWGLKILGFIDEEDRLGMRVGNGKVIGCLGQLADILDGNAVNEVFFILPPEMMQGLEDKIRACEHVGVRATIAADLFSTQIAKPVARQLGGIPLVSFDSVPHGPMHLLLKRSMDVLVSLAALLGFSPLIAVSAAAIKIDSPGPVLFRQKRCGLYGKTFTCYKFRTMVAGADRMLTGIRHLNESEGPVFHARNDPRVTRTGRFLRRTSLDELPQLINVLMGDMSIVGPRPPIPEEVKAYERWQRRRLSMRPGIVCTWQVSRRFQPDFRKWMRMDLEYIDNWSLGLDLQILFRVLPSLLRGFIYWKAETLPD